MSSPHKSITFRRSRHAQSAWTTSHPVAVVLGKAGRGSNLLLFVPLALPPPPPSARSPSRTSAR